MVRNDGGAELRGFSDHGSRALSPARPRAHADHPRVQVAPDNESHPLRLLPTHKRSFSACWLNFLKLPLSPEVFKNVLLILPDQVMPHLVDPKLLIDFLRDSYDMGGATSILALQGVFVLIYHHNLDYPDFYKKLYQLLDAAVFLMKFRCVGRLPLVNGPGWRCAPLPVRPLPSTYTPNHLPPARPGPCACGHRDADRGSSGSWTNSYSRRFCRATWSQRSSSACRVSRSAPRRRGAWSQYGSFTIC